LSIWQYKITFNKIKHRGKFINHLDAFGILTRSEKETTEIEKKR
jgi:hypothetical protein